VQTFIPRVPRVQRISLRSRFGRLARLAGAAQTWTVPDGVNAATFDVLGAQGGGSFGGAGGEAIATISLTPGQQLQVNVGGAGGNTGAGGFNGGGGYFGGGGGIGGVTGRSTSGTVFVSPGARGGGGSGFGPAGVVFHDGVRGGNGLIVVTYWPATSTTTATTPSPTPTPTPGAPLVPTPTPTPSTPTNGTAPRPDLAGARIRQAGDPAIYLVDDDGTLRHVPDPATYNNLFRDGNGVQQLTNVSSITTGPELTSGAHLAIAQETMSAVYLIDNGQKRHVTSPQVMDKFYFNWNQVQPVPQSTLDALPDGAPLT
jgi:hypothetical protein